MVLTVDLLLDIRADLGEGSLWDEREKLLYWVDINGHKVYVYNPATGANIGYDVGQQVGTVVLRESGGVMLALKHGFASYDLASGKLEMIADPEADKPNNRFNDGKCDPAGRFWAGSISRAPQDGALFRLDADMSVHKMIDDISCSNGIVWTSDRKTMYYIDSPVRTVVAYDYDDATGAISNGRVVINVPEEKGVPDGMAIDSEGMLWIAHYNGSAVHRWNPTTGEIMETIELPVSRVTSCAFGGENLDTLYITTAINGMSAEENAKQPHAGSLFVAKPGVTGTLSYRFKG